MDHPRDRTGDDVGEHLIDDTAPADRKLRSVNWWYHRFITISPLASRLGLIFFPA